MPDQEFSATVRRISPTIDTRNGTFRATAYVDNDNGLLAPGMFGRFEIAYEKHSEALVIPVAAVLEEDNVSVVYVVQDGTAVRKMITTGIEEDGQIEILSGLAGDERIILTGQNSLREGSKVLASLPLSVPGRRLANQQTGPMMISGEHRARTNTAHFTQSSLRWPTLLHSPYYSGRLQSVGTGHRNIRGGSGGCSGRNDHADPQRYRCHVLRDSPDRSFCRCHGHRESQWRSSGNFRRRR